MGKAYLVLSGKGGVGKTMLSTSVALLLAKRGFTVALLDADVGLRCADQLYGVESQVVFDAGDVLEKRCTLQMAYTRVPGVDKLTLIAAPQLMLPSDVDKPEMTRMIKALKREHDFVFIDCPAGIGRGIKNVWGAAEEAILVATPDDACLRDAERMASLLFEKQGLHPQLALNRVDRLMIWDKDMKRPGDIAQALDMRLLTAIPNDASIYRALLNHQCAAYANSRRVRKALDLAVDRLLFMDKPLPRYCR